MSDQAEALKKLAVARGVVDPEEPPAPENGTGGPGAIGLARGVPEVQLPGDFSLLSTFAREMGRIMSQDFLYRRGDTVLMVNERDRRLEAVDADAFRSLAERRMVPVRKVVARQGEFSVIQTMEVQIARGCLRAPEFWQQLPEIERVNSVRLPVLRPCGRNAQGEVVPGKIELLPEGYDAESRTYTFPSGLAYDEAMTLDQAADVLQSLTSEFPFGDWPEHKDGDTGPLEPPRSQAVVIAGMLTMFGAGLLPALARKPAFVYTSNSVGSGKTLLAEIAVAAVMGEAAATPWPAREEELQKRLDTAIMNRKLYLLFDNLRGMLKSPSLEGLVTSSAWGGRVLGGNEEFTLPNLLTIFVTGNAVTLNDDMSRRCLLVELFVEEADVQKRKISREIDVRWVCLAENRARILSAMWALIRAWDAAGRKEHPKRFASFMDWARVIGGVVKFAGLGDALAPAELSHGGATEATDIPKLVRLLSDQRPLAKTTEFEFPLIVKAAVEAGLIEWITQDEELDQKQRSNFGKMLRRWEGRTFDYADGLQIRFGLRGKHRGRRYTLARLAEPRAAGAGAAPSTAGE